MRLVARRRLMTVVLLAVALAGLLTYLSLGWSSDWSVQGQTGVEPDPTATPVPPPPPPPPPPSPPPPTAEPTPDPIVTIVPEVNVPSSVTVGDAGIGKADDGSTVASTGGTVEIRGLGEKLTLPISLSFGRTLDEFNDQTSGLSVSREQVTNPQTGRTEERSVVQIPVKDDQGNTQLKYPGDAGGAPGRRRWS